MDEIRQRIRDAVDAKLTTYKDLSAAIGRNHAYVQQFVERGTPQELRQRDAETILGVIDGAGSRPAPRRGFAPVLVPGEQLVRGDRRLPVYAAARGGDGHVIVTFDPVEYVKMPTILESVRGGYGLLITGDSMVPAYWPGDTALIHPSLPAQRDTDVVLYHTPPEPKGGDEAMIKRLVGMSEREWTLQQYQPANIFKEFRADWPVCHRVVGKYNSR
ncbi:hypothetical protein MesoLjLc_21910 [Mesorhizobium sp. L-8-10]|uniref:S24 family peptidase n=1 Tax=Mesorhizobium sp. L-8-10 TaxID=2744523 RepID=UPI0019277BD6|nr:helix-turn-helix transcriptional regulator [Mesorhizobium sp. L-8-10]BCH30261.1 hypothetical protein MesoLjLc_21910 [Mesorhizobium sp. L-8-10]